MSEVTRIVAALNWGEPTAMDRLVPLIYGELRELARRQLAKERAGHTLRTTALDHEAYLRLFASPAGRATLNPDGRQSP